MKKYKVLLLVAIVAVASVSVSAAALAKTGISGSHISRMEKIENSDTPKMFKRGIRPENADFERKELTEEEKAEALEKMKADLSEKLANGEMTEEEYAKALENLENGKPVRGMKKPLGEGKELTDEEIAEMKEKGEKPPRMKGGREKNKSEEE